MHLLIKSRPAAADVLAHRFLGLDTGKLSHCGAGARAIGASLDLDVAQGNTCDVVLIGLVQIVAGADLLDNQKVASDANGRAVLAVSPNQVNGVVWRGGPTGSLVEILLTPVPV